MTKRILIGNDGSGQFRIRASAAGHNVETAPLDQILFDADAVPGRIITQGEQWCDWNPNQPSEPGTPRVTSFAHGVPVGLSFIVSAIGRPMYSDGSLPPDWLYWTWDLFTPGSTQRVVVRRVLGNGAMTNQYCTPFRFSGDDGAGFPNWGGWWVSWDGASIHVANNCGHGLYTRWQALEV